MVPGSGEDDVSRRRRRQVGRLRLLSVMSAHIMLHHMHTHTHIHPDYWMRHIYVLELLLLLLLQYNFLCPLCRDYWGRG